MTVVITGGGSGIGQALAWRLADASYDVLIIGRRPEALAETQRQYPNIRSCAADISQEEGRRRIVDVLGDAPVRWLVQNAGVLQPVGPLLEQSAGDLRASWAINVEGPIALSSLLIGQMREGSRILHVSSGAAHTAYPGWGAYCMTKAALHMAYEILRAELSDRQVAVGSLRPGVVDTPMQALIRVQKEEDFPAVERFQALKSSGALLAPGDVAAFMHFMLESMDANTFSEKEWDVRDASAEHLT